jgi:hypothetical protein
VKRWSATGYESCFKDFKQFLLGCAEADGTSHVRHQPVSVGTPEGQERDGDKFAHFGRDMLSLTQRQLIESVPSAPMIYRILRRATIDIAASQYTQSASDRV